MCSLIQGSYVLQLPVCVSWKACMTQITIPVSVSRLYLQRGHAVSRHVPSRARLRHEGMHISGH